MATLAQFVSFAVFTFGALAFSLLAVSYVRQGARAGLFRWFTLVCAAAFVSNLSGTLFFLSDPWFVWAQSLLVGVLPAMLFHLVLEQQVAVPAKSLWRGAAAVFYGAALVPAEWVDPAWRLAAASFAAILLLAVGKEAGAATAQRHRLWNGVLFGAMLAVSVATQLSENPILGLLPDYLLLWFFAVWLYYSERLAFFDVFLKRGVYFFAGALALAMVASVFPQPPAAMAVLLGLWLAGPPLYGRLARLVDERALGRRFSPVEAERVMQEAVHVAESTGDLAERVRVAMEAIFACRASVDFAGVETRNEALARTGNVAVAGLVRGGWIRLDKRENAMPFLSDDLRLLRTLATAVDAAQLSLEHRIRQRELAALAARAELRALRAQINPHFLFNALNTIAGWIRTRPDLADETVARLAEVFRYVLCLSENEWVRLGEELNFVEAYLAVEQARFQDRLKITIERGSTAEEQQIPSMVVQPLVENAIKHGVAQRLDGAEIRVGVSSANGTVRVRVEDSGPGFPAGFQLDGEGAGHGLRNIAARLDGHFAGKATLQWENTASGCAVWIEIPCGGAG
jgi:signal transduction histidine kinase